MQRLLSDALRVSLLLLERPVQSVTI